MRFFVFCLSVCLFLSCAKSEVKSTANDAEVNNKTRAINSINDEESLDKTRMLNSICPTRQHIQECREWCKRVDCRE